MKIFDEKFYNICVDFRKRQILKNTRELIGVLQISAMMKCRELELG